MARRGRPSKFTEDRGEAIIAVMRVGAYLEDAAAYSGISISTVRNWLRAGAQARQLLDTGTRITKEQRLLADFHVGFEKATTVWEIEALSKLTQSDDIKALTWRLERRFPERWGNRQKITVDDTAALEAERRRAEDDRIRRQIAASLMDSPVAAPCIHDDGSPSPEQLEAIHQADPIRSLYGCN